MTDDAARLRRKLISARAEIRRLTRRLRNAITAIKSEKYVPVEDYEELSDLAGILTEKFRDVYHTSRRGPRVKAAKAADHRHRAQMIYDEKRSKPGTSKALARRRTVKRLKELHSADDAVHVYSEEGLRKILTD